MASCDWSRPFESSFLLVRVDRRTGDETEVLDNALPGGSVERNQDTTTFEGASLDYAGSLDVGADLVRCYLVPTQGGAACDRVALGTWLPATPSRTSDGRYSRGTAKMCGRLKELSDDAFDSPVSLPAGTNLVAWARQTCEACGLSVVAAASEATLTQTWTLGTARTGDADDCSTKLAAVNRALDLAGFDSARTDPMGRVVMRRSRDVDARTAVWAFEEGASARFLTEATEEFDCGGVANVVHADYSGRDADGNDATVRGVAIDSDPSSPYSTASVGRRIVASYSYDDLPTGSTSAEMQAAANAKAAELLATQRSVIRRVGFTHAYAPVAVGDVVTFDYRSAAMSGAFAIRKQTITLGAGCQVTEEARRFER